MKTLINVSVIVVALLGILGMYISLKGDIVHPPVVATASR